MFIKPCPFCGGRAEIFDDVYEDIVLYSVVCISCGVSTAERGEKEEAINDWNRRMNDDKSEINTSP